MQVMGKHKRGDVRADGKVFLRYAKGCKNGEYWVTAEKFKESVEAQKNWRKEWRLKNAQREVERTRKWRLANPEKVKESARKSHIKNKEKAAIDHKKWCAANKDHINAYNKKRAKTDPVVRIKRNLRAGFKQALNAHLNSSSESAASFKYLGCSIPELIKHLESKFKEGMTWDNYGRDGWHIDHIKPMCMFDLLKVSEQKKACHYTNMQPLWADENTAKGGRWIG